MHTQTYIISAVKTLKKSNKLPGMAAIFSENQAINAYGYFLEKNGISSDSTKSMYFTMI